MTTTVEQLTDPLIAGVVANLGECANIMNKGDICVCSLKTHLAIVAESHLPVPGLVEKDHPLRHVEKCSQRNFVTITIQ